MERRDYWLLFGRTLCMALAVAVLAIAPRSEEEPTGTLAVFVYVSSFFLKHKLYVLYHICHCYFR